MAERVVEENAVHTGERILGAGGCAAQRLIAAIDDRAPIRGLFTNQCLEEVCALRELKDDGRSAILCADFPGAGEDDARGLKRGQPQELMHLARKQVVPGPPRQEEVEMAAVR